MLHNIFGIWFDSSFFGHLGSLGMATFRSKRKGSISLPGALFGMHWFNCFDAKLALRCFASCIAWSTVALRLEWPETIRGQNPFFKFPISGGHSKKPRWKMLKSPKCFFHFKDFEECQKQSLSGLLFYGLRFSEAQSHQPTFSFQPQNSLLHNLMKIGLLEFLHTCKKSCMDKYRNTQDQYTILEILDSMSKSQSGTTSWKCFQHMCTWMQECKKYFSFQGTEHEKLRFWWETGPHLWKLLQPGSTGSRRFCCNKRPINSNMETWRFFYKHITVCGRTHHRYP